MHLPTPITTTDFHRKCKKISAKAWAIVGNDGDSLTMDDNSLSPDSFWNQIKENNFSDFHH